MAYPDDIYRHHSDIFLSTDLVDRSQTSATRSQLTEAQAIEKEQKKVHKAPL